MMGAIGILGCTQRVPVAFGAPAPGPTARLDPRAIPKFVTPLPIPPVAVPWEVKDGVPEFHLSVRRVYQQVLPRGLPATPVFAFGDPADPGSFGWPGPTMEARTGASLRVVWGNELAEGGRFLPHLLPMDATLHWANPPGPVDTHGQAPGYDGPVPIVVHVHGAHTDAESDGFPEAWYLPDALDIPDGYARVGSAYATTAPAAEGQAVFSYRSDYDAATRIYHDHTLGLTRLNVYAGMTGFWLVRDAVEDALGLPAPTPAAGDLPGVRYHEIPLLIADRSFYEDGSLYYPSGRAEFDGYDGPFMPESEVPPVWNPEFFGDVMTVNGASWPVLDVEPALYRFRLANGSNSRFVELGFDDPELRFVHLGSDGGFIPGTPEQTDRILLAPSARDDVIVDLRALFPGQQVTVLNFAPDAPYTGSDDPPPDPETTGQVLRLRVVYPKRRKIEHLPTVLPPIAALVPDHPTRDLLLWERMDQGVPAEAQLGTVNDGPLGWDDGVTEIVDVGATEEWRIVNLSDDAHPIHPHLVQVQVLGRTPIDADRFRKAEERWLAGRGPRPDIDDYVIGVTRPPEPSERGRKDVVIARPGEVLSFVGRFDLPGRYVWHCHVLEHEDNEMMREVLVR